MKNATQPAPRGAMARVLTAWSICAMLASSATVDAATKRLPTHEDIWLMKRVGAPIVSPDGRWIVVSVIEPAYEENAQLSDLWLIDTSARHSSRRLTSTRRAENGVIWSTDSHRIYFSAQRDNDDAPQVYSLDLKAGGEAERVTNASGGGRVPAISPDGRQLAYVSIMYRDARDEAANKAMIAEHRDRKSSARIYDSFPVRSWDHWLDAREARILVQPLDESGAPAGPPRDLLFDTKLAASPGFAGRQTDTGEEIDLEFAPDGKSLVFAATTNRNAAAYSFTDSQLFEVDVGGGEPRRLTSGSFNWSQPRFTPDGHKLVAILETQGDQYVYNESRLAAFDWPITGAPRAITSALDRSVDSFAITPDSRNVYFTAEDGGNGKLFSVRIDGGKVLSLFGAGTGGFSNITIPSHADDVALYGNWESASAPGEVAAITQTGKPLVLTKFNEARASQLDLPPVENFWFTSSRGKRVHSLLVRPPGFDPTRKYPLVVLIHGGPHSMWRDQFLFRWNYHLLAAPGYVLLLTNYSGSTGFGEEFSRSIQGDPLKGPGDELNEAADAAIRQFAFIDGSRQCAGGASYGGHLSNWLQASTTRYKCLFSHAGLINLETQWGTSDTIYSREINMGGPPWEQGPVWREQNPIRRAANFRTPVLVTVGENDFRVPLNNSLEYWSALQRLQVPSRLIVFPEENHWILKGEDSRLFYSELATWLDRWLKPVP